MTNSWTPADPQCLREAGHTGPCRVHTGWADVTPDDPCLPKMMEILDQLATCAARSRRTGTAVRTTIHTAREAFTIGTRICVAIGQPATFPVYHPDTTTHHRSNTTWDALAATVESYGDPRQRWYVVLPLPTD